jgi:hypothetical protein
MGADATYHGGMADTAAGSRSVMRDRMEELRVATRRLAGALADLEGTYDEVIASLDRGDPLLETYGTVGFNRARDLTFAATSAFDAAFGAARAAGIRVLVDEGLSLSEIARLMGRSRQFVTRLYRQAEPLP